MEAYVTNKYGDDEVYVIASGLGVMRLDASNIKGTIKKGDKFEGYHAGGSYVAEKRV